MGALGGGKGSHVGPEPHADAIERHPRSNLRGLSLLSVRVSCPGPESRIRTSRCGVRSELLLVGAYPSRNELSRDLKGSYVRYLSPEPSWSGGPAKRCPADQMRRAPHPHRSEFHCVREARVIGRTRTRNGPTPSRSFLGGEPSPPEEESPGSISHNWPRGRSEWALLGDDHVPALLQRL